MIAEDHERIKIYRQHVNSTESNVLQNTSGDIDIVGFSGLFKKLCRLIGSGQFMAEWISESIFLLLKEGESNELLLELKKFKSLFDNDVFNTKNVFTVNYDGSLINDNPDLYIDPDIPTFSRLCEKENCIGIQLRGKSISVYTAEKGLIDIIHNVNTTSRKSEVSSVNEHISNYEALLKKHYSKDLHQEKTIKYWQPGRKTGSHILKNAPEEIFNTALFSFLRDNTILTHVAIEHRVEGGRDEIDIYAKAEDSDISYLFEVKWLGKCQNNTQYDAKRANSGLKQIDLYIKGSANKSVGVLVLYDARLIKNKLKLIPELIKNLDSDVRTPISISLYDTTASKSAEKEVKRLY